ncbi:MAG: AAA family ATPase [Saprospiraceae bacterium]|jgi:DNA replication ATP-dependent helicase Dna2|nr:AAA family ATPase [Saprospiraceae bacterium]MBK9378426.1 AAA family ATPase [Saprospiraceae bacterium]MBL0259704.1 AAA family ATPase [Saprospiraceae bacterium]MBX7164347.1 AAA family ATPase [Saprospiraceae bacterium]
MSPQNDFPEIKTTPEISRLNVLRAYGNQYQLFYEYALLHSGKSAKTSIQISPVLFRMVRENILNEDSMEAILRFMNLDIDKLHFDELKTEIERANRVYQRIQLNGNNESSFVEENDLEYSKTLNDEFKNKAGYLIILAPGESENEFYFQFDGGSEKKDKLKLTKEAIQQNKLLHAFLKLNILPVKVHALELQQIEDEYQAGYLIFYPDYLLDITAIAECFYTDGANPYKHLISLFYFDSFSKAMLVGTLINDYLDQLIIEKNLSFAEVFKNVFWTNPLAFVLFSDDELLEFRTKLKMQFDHLKALVSNRFDGLIEDLGYCDLEPSFYSRKYGIQGRLDVFFKNNEVNRATIIELKSGKPYKPNLNGINRNHHVQATLYKYLIQSVWPDLGQADCYILYSVLSSGALRISPESSSDFYSILQMRNQLLFLHFALAGQSEKHLFDELHYRHFEKIDSFMLTKAKSVVDIYQNCDQLEKEYFKTYIAAVAREQIYSKLGSTSSDTGVSGLWLVDAKQKEIEYNLIADLRIDEIVLERREFPILLLKNKNGSSLSHNFRVGDTLLLYKQIQNKPDVMHQQVYKCTLLEVQPQMVHIRLRCRQFRENIDDVSSIWNLEHDHLDRSFIQQYQNLHTFLSAESRIRKLYLSQEKPVLRTDASIYYASPELRTEHLTIIQRILNAQDYFLLWGPPGTGKTSIIVKHLCKYFIGCSEESVLLLAYTNRAVDEMCSAALEIIEENSLIRIGSRYAVHQDFRHYLLEEVSMQFNSRALLLDHLQKTRLYAATVASILGKKELFDVKQFDILIIDEASQILEPHIIGLLPLFKRVIFIGDHLQLPAVSVQDESQSIILNQELLQAGFRSTSESLFERLWKQCVVKEWEHCIGMLQSQGRMHLEIMDIVNQLFYQSKLEVMNRDKNGKQLRLLSHPDSLSSNPNNIFPNKRLVFIDVGKSESNFSFKTNRAEALIVAELVEQIYHHYKEENLIWSSESVGVITPFRAQITAIRAALYERGLDKIDLTVDTVERYQGSARDIIILSTVIQDSRLLSQIQSVDANGIDRKLNVALSRARERIIICGVSDALQNSTEYQYLLANFTRINMGSPKS